MTNIYVVNMLYVSLYTIMKMHVPNNIWNPPLTKSAQHM